MNKLVSAAITGLSALALTMPAFAQGAGYQQQYPQQQQGQYQQQQYQQPMLQQQQGGYEAPGQQGYNGLSSQQAQMAPPGSYLQNEPPQGMQNQQPQQQYGQVSSTNEQDQQQQQKKKGGTGHAIKSIMLGSAQVAGQTARVAAPVAGGLMMMSAARSMSMNPMMYGGYGYNPYGYGMGMGTMMMAPALMNAGMGMMSTAGRY